MTSFGVVRAFFFSRPSAGSVARCGDADECDDEVTVCFLVRTSSAISATTSDTVIRCSCIVVSRCSKCDLCHCRQSVFIHVSTFGSEHLFI